ncbi:MAG: phosphatase PAP2 family protein [Bacteroidota bacterium]
MKKIIIFLISCSILFNADAQNKKPEHVKVYNLNYKIEIPVTIGLIAANYYGFGVIRRKPNLDANQINSLNKNDVWAFDRRALEQNYSYSSREKALAASDWGMNISIFLPSLLFLDKKIRKDWYDIILLYVETQFTGSNMYAYTGPMITERVRPFVYYPEIPLEDKLGNGTTDSFFSGHTTLTATASFFMAKVISDYHPELGAKKWLLYAAALIPPTFVGYHRYRGLKHFPTDIAVGTVVGAAVGILIPHFHKITRNSNVSLVPYTGEYSGLAFSMKF